MAFSTLYLSSAGGQSKRGKAPAEFTYQTTDSLATMTAAGYIASPNHLLFKIGDRILFSIVDNADTPTQLIQTGELIVASISSAGSVTLVDITSGELGVETTIRMPFFFNQTDLLAGTSQFILSPVAGTLKRLVTVVSVAVTTGGAIGVELAGTAVSGLSITVADAATVGTVQSDTPTSTQRLTADQAIEVTATAAFATAGSVFGYVEIIPDVYTGDIYVPFFFNQTDLLAATSQWWPSPEGGTITHAAAVVQTAVTTGGDITVELATVAITGLTLTIADAATVGTVVSDDPTSPTAVTKEQAIEVVAAAAFATAGAVNGYVTVRPTIPTRNAYVFWSANQTDVLAATSHFVVSPITGNVTRGVTATQVAVGTGGNVTVELGGTAVLGLTIVVANSAAAGDIDRDNSTSPDDITTEVAELDDIEIVFDAAFATTGALNGFVEVQP